MTLQRFSAVDKEVNFPKLEEEILEFWRSSKTFQKSLDITRKGRPYVFYDGPPFATGLPHYGHLLAGTLKDIIPRYWTMRGFFVERRFGWDCHGLPVENEMEKELNISGKRVIEKLGIHIFNEACRSIVLRYTAQWQEVVERMGRWVDFERQYRTMDPAYMESIWWVFKQVWDKGLIYRGFKIQPYCPRCATPLSNFEVNEGYRDVKGPSITVAMPLKDDPSTKILVWTTTPWTLPSNVVLAAGPSITYVKVKDGNNFFILAKERLSAYYRNESEYEIVDQMSGTQLQGISYIPLFDYFANRSPKFFKVEMADFVSTEDGTGIVHIAPAFGEDDFLLGQQLGLPIICPVDEEGKFTAEVPQWQGMLVFEADEPITKEIKQKGRLIHRSHIEHRYPFCYRCDTPLIYKAITTWFMKIEPLKPIMLEANRRIHWVPEHIQNGRFGKGIESAPDWNISRNRYWGTPLPVWLCGCGHQECVGSLAQLHKLVGEGNETEGRKRHESTVDLVAAEIKQQAAERLSKFGVDSSWVEKVCGSVIGPNDIHPHIVDRMQFVCPKCKSTMKRTPEVLDCWFESGAMPYAQNHYPFEKAEKFEHSFPADFIAEGLDQTRGWFYTLTVLAAALFGKEAFKNVVVNGIILAEDGKKLSKRLKNYTPPQEVLRKLGADALRLFLINSPAVKAEDLRFSEKGVAEMARTVLLPLWNSYSFFVTYANVDGYIPKQEYEGQSENELDRWIVSLLHNTIELVTQEMEQYNLYRVVPLLVDFIDSLTNWYIRRSRRRFWKSENDQDKAYAYDTLYHVLVVFSRVMAPFLPFTTEAIYRNLVVRFFPDAAESIHLTPYPVAQHRVIDRVLEEKMELVRNTVAIARALRSKFQLKIRQPLQRLTVVVADERKRQLLSSMAELIADELNVKEVNFDADENKLVSISAKPNYKRLGKIFGSQMKEASKIIEGFSAEQIRRLQKGDVIEVLQHKIALEDIEVRRTKIGGLEVQTEKDITVALTTDISEELLQEGIAREFINRIQNIRKNSNFDVTDRISIVCISDNETLCNALLKHRDYICAETLAIGFNIEGPGLTAYEPIEINGIEAKVAVKLAK